MDKNFPKIPDPPKNFDTDEAEAFRYVMLLFAMNYKEIPKIKKISAIDESGFEGYQLCSSSLNYLFGFYVNFKQKEFLVLGLNIDENLSYILKRLECNGWNWSRKVIIQKQKGSNKSSCYIASAIYSSNSYEVAVLKKWRDEVLMNNYITRILVNIYYKISPNLVKHLRRSKIIRSIIKSIIDFKVKRLASISQNKGKKNCWK